MSNSSEEFKLTTIYYKIDNNKLFMQKRIFLTNQLIIVRHKLGVGKVNF